MSTLNTAGRKQVARIGNEATLILKLAKERAKGKLEEAIRNELNFRSQPGNYPEKFSWQDALMNGFRRGVKLYGEALDGVVLEIEQR